MEDAIRKAVEWIFSVLTTDISKGIWDLFAALFENPVIIFQDDDIRFVQVFMTTLALGLLPLLIIIQSMRLSAARALGVNTMPPEVLVHRAVVAGAACTSISTVAWLLITFGDNITKTFAKLGLDLTLLKLLFEAPTGGGLGIIFLVIILLIGAILLTIQKAIISAELAAMLAFGPVSGLSLLHGEGGFFNTWLRETASLVLTPMIQLIITWLFLRKVVDLFLIVDINTGTVAIPNSIEAWWQARLLTLGYLWVIWRCPAWLRQFAYSAGHGDLLVQGGASVGRFVVMRKMFAAAAKSVVPK